MDIYKLIDQAANLITRGEMQKILDTEIAASMFSFPEIT